MKSQTVPYLRLVNILTTQLVCFTSALLSKILLMIVALLANQMLLDVIQI